MTAIALFLTLVVPMICLGQGRVSTYAGTGEPGLNNGERLTAMFDLPFGMCADSEGNLYIADGDNHCIRKIDRSGEVTTYAGAGVAGYADGPAENALFNQPVGLCFDASGALYVADFLNHRIRRVAANGTVTTVAGTGEAGFADGLPASAQFNFPRALAIDGAGNIYIADSWNHRIRKIGLTEQVTTVAGGGDDIGVGSVGDLVDGPGAEARFYTPSGLDVDSEGNLYVADPFNHRIRKITPQGDVSTIAGSGLTGPDNGAFFDGDALTIAIFNTPTELRVLPSGDILIGDTFNNRVRRLTAGGQVQTVAGEFDAGFDNGPIDDATFDFPRGIVATAQGDSIFVVDHNNHAVRLIELNPQTSVAERGAVVQSALTVFPNPTERYTTLRIPNLPVGVKAQAHVTDVSGKLLLQLPVTTMPFTIDLDHLPSGLYAIRIRSAARDLESFVLKY